MAVEVVQRWETDRRYYVVRVYRDLFGQWVITRAWGGKRNRLGQLRTRPVRGMYGGLRALADVAEERRRRKYVPVSPVPA